jgi:hypothetical protein
MLLRRVRDTFTMRRWCTNPFQLWNVTLLLQVSLHLVVFGEAPTQNATAQGVLDSHAQFALAACNLFGTSICLFGLHLRDISTALWIELSGYISLIGSVGIYLVLAYVVFGWPTTSFGLALTQAFVLASIHRIVQIIQYKRARRRRTFLEAEMLRRRLDEGDFDG